MSRTAKNKIQEKETAQEATTQAQEVVVNETPKKETTKEIPAEVDNILKQFPQYSKLYISRVGGVYTENTPEFIRKDAVLYENKYFK